MTENLTKEKQVVLIVEDNPLNMKLFSDLVESKGYQVLKTKSGKQAWDWVKAYHPQLVLMDIQLPDVAGFDVIKWIKSDPQTKQIPVIAITAFALRGDAEKILESGCEEYISKPISVDHFLKTISKFLPPKNLP